jgi:hypothetical protein
LRSRLGHRCADQIGGREDFLGPLVAARQRLDLLNNK